MNVGRGCGNVNAVQMEGDALHLSISSIEVNGSNIFSVVGGCIGLGICQKVTMDVSLGSTEESAPPRLNRSSCQATPALILPKGSGIYFGNPTLSREADGRLALTEGRIAWSKSCDLGSLLSLISSSSSP